MSSCDTSAAEGLSAEHGGNLDVIRRAIERAYCKERVVVPSKDMDSVGEYGCKQSSSMVASQM